MAELALNIEAPHAKQQYILDNSKQNNVVACPRRWGKTTMIYMLIAIHIIYNLSTGRNADICIISPSLQNLNPIWHKFKERFSSLFSSPPNEADASKVSEKYHFAWIQGKFKVEFWSIEQIEYIRGRAYCLLLVDETASINGLLEMWQAVLFATLDDWNGKSYLFGTPKGFNDFYTFYNYGSKEIFSSFWASFTGHYLDNITTTYEDKLLRFEQAKATMQPDFFAQEYEAQFVAIGNQLFNRFDFMNNEKFLSLDDMVGNPLIQVRYWDIAGSDNAKADSTASVKLTLTDAGNYYISHPFEMKGLYGNTYPFMKKLMQIEATEGVRQVIETDGIGLIAWQMIMSDKELAGVLRYPADRRFTQNGKYDRAALCALEAQLGRMKMVGDEGKMSTVLDQVERFPLAQHDDFVDSISGAMLSINFLFGGFASLFKKGSQQFVQRVIGRLDQSRNINRKKTNNWLRKLSDNNF